MSSNYNVLLKFGINVTNKVQRKRSSTYLLALCLTFCSLIYVFCAITFDEGEDLPQIIVNVPHLDRNLSGKKVPDGFLIWSPSCIIPDLDPLAEDVMHIFQREKYESCTTSEPLTRIEWNRTTSEAELIYDDTSKWYSWLAKRSCSYSEIFRSEGGENVDSQFQFSTSVYFSTSIKLPPTVEFIFVKCSVFGIPVYRNTHAIVRDRPEIRQRLKQSKEKHKNLRQLSVLLLAIDSISRSNLIRAMPKTAQHLYDTGWFELQGYNKASESIPNSEVKNKQLKRFQIEDNTFPNVMAILTGNSFPLIEKICNPYVLGQLDACSFIWTEFKKSGYVTSYGEDETWMSSFNYLKFGFSQPPTDYYLRPYMLAAEKYLSTSTKHRMTYCLGYKQSVEHIYDFAIDFATYYKNDASFGLHWVNTFSHNDISSPSSMDDKMRSYLNVLDSRGILNESMVVLLSDHGMRFGPTRRLFSGWLEERLPFIFIWLPEWFRKEHPEIVNALNVNRNRLTNPYDLHMTLKHVLQLSNPEQSYELATSCPNCQSLFIEVPWNRSCEEASIETHWCTCTLYKEHDKDDPVIEKAVDFTISQINHDLKNYYTRDDGKKPLCAELTMKSIANSREARNEHGKYNDYVIVFEVSPSNGWFETTMRYRLATKEFEVTGSVSRLDSYASQSHCMKNAYLKKYCFCTE